MAWAYAIVTYVLAIFIAMAISAAEDHYWNWTYDGRTAVRFWQAFLFVGLVGTIIYGLRVGSFT